MRLWALLLLCACSALAQTTNGLGHSTYTCLDKDGDGYGAGETCTAPDADDKDADVHTAAEGITKYGTLAAFLAHLGYTPTRIWYIAPVTANPPGDNDTGVVNDITHPFEDWSNASMRASLQAGDMVMFRAGTWDETLLGELEAVDPAISGTAADPLIFMAYPGEAAWLDCSVSGHACIKLDDKSYVTVDGIKVTGGATSGSGCISGGTAEDIGFSRSLTNVIRNVEISHCSTGLVFSNGLDDMLVEDNIFHDLDTGNAEHCVYLSSKDLTSSDVILRRNICYNADKNGFHFNGRFLNAQIDQNLIYNIGEAAGIGLQQGTSNSFIRGNLIFNVGANSIAIDDYNSGECELYPPQVGHICPYDQSGNLFENNTLYQTGYDPVHQIQYNSQSNTVVANSSPNTTADLGNNTWRNNIFYTIGYNANVAFYDGDYGCDSECQSWAKTSTFENNIFYHDSSYGGGNNGVVSLGAGMGNGGYSCATAGTVTTMTNCQNADPLLVDESPTYWNSPTSFDFNLAANSPAIGAGTSTGALSYDLVGNFLRNPPSLGAYEVKGVWTQLVNTKLQTVCPPNNWGVGDGMPAYDFFGLCYGKITEWNSAAVDTLRGRLVIWGGGHAGYRGSELYSVDPVAASISIATSVAGYPQSACGGNDCLIRSNPNPPAMVRLDDPTIWATSPDDCRDNAYGSPDSEHTYAAFIYLPKHDRFFSWLGLPFCGSGFNWPDTRVWSLHPTTMVWTELNVDLSALGSLSGHLGAFCAVDPTTAHETALCIFGGGTNNELVRFDFDDNTVTALGGMSAVQSAPGVVVDPDRGLLYAVGNRYNTPTESDPRWYAINTTTGAVQDWTASLTGCADLIGYAYPSVTWDPTLHKVVGYVPRTFASSDANNLIFVFDPATRTCTQRNIGGGPPAHSVIRGVGVDERGMFGRFGYVPSLNQYILVNNHLEDAYLFDLDLPGEASAQRLDGSTLQGTKVR